MSLEACVCLNAWLVKFLCIFNLEHASLIDLLTEELVICLSLFIKTYPSIDEVWWSM